MTTGGWIFMLGSIAFVVGLISFCFFRVLSPPSTANHLHPPPLEIDTHDKGT